MKPFIFSFAAYLFGLILLYWIVSVRNKSTFKLHDHLSQIAMRSFFGLGLSLVFALVLKYQYVVFILMAAIAFSSNYIFAFLEKKKGPEPFVYGRTFSSDYERETKTMWIPQLGLSLLTLAAAGCFFVFPTFLNQYALPLSFRSVVGLLCFGASVFVIWWGPYKEWEGAQYLPGWGVPLFFGAILSYGPENIFD